MPKNLVRLAVGVALLLGCARWAAAESDSLFARRWNWSAYGFDIGAAGLELLDVDSDGELELVVVASAAGRPAYWYVLKFGSGEDHQVHSSSWYPDGIGGFDVAQVDPGGGLEVVIASATQLHVESAATGERLRSFTTVVAEPTALAAGDLDADGSVEAVLLDENDLFIYDLATGDLKASKPGFGGWSTDLGAADADAALEIAVANGQLFGYVLDGATLTIDWGRNEGLGYEVRFGQLDADPALELLAAWPYGEGVVAVDPASGTELWQREDLSADSIRAADLDGVPGDEVVVGGTQWDQVEVLAGASGESLAPIASPGYGTGGIAVGDGDGDGQIEVYWGTSERLLAADAASRAREWESRALTGPFLGLTAADLEGDGRPELLTASFRSMGVSSDGTVVALNAYDERRIWFSEPGEPPFTTGLWRVRAANLDADAGDEYCIATSELYDGRIACFDGLTRQEQWSVRLPGGLTTHSLAIADVDDDGELEVIAGTNVEHTGAPGSFVYCFQADTGWLEWRTVDLGSAWSDYTQLRVGQLDGDPPLEVVAAVGWSDPVVVLDGASGAVQGGPWELGASAVHVADLDGLPLDELYVGTDAGELRRVDPTDGSTELLFVVEGEPSSLNHSDLDDDSAPELLYVAAGEIFARRVDDGALVWQSGWLDENERHPDTLLVDDVDADGRVDVVVGTSIGISVFATSAGAAPLFDDGFESGDSGAWSRTEGG